MKQEYTFEEILVLLERARMDDVSDRLRELWAEMVSDKARLMIDRDCLLSALSSVAVADMSTTQKRAEARKIATAAIQKVSK